MTDYFKQWAQEGLPVINWHYRWSIFWSNNLRNIDRFLCTALYACAKLLQTGYWSSPKCFLQQAEATVGRKLCVQQSGSGVALCGEDHRMFSTSDMPEQSYFCSGHCSYHSADQLPIFLAHNIRRNNAGN